MLLLGASGMDDTGGIRIFPNEEGFERSNPTNLTEGSEFFRNAHANFRVHDTDEATSISTEEDTFTSSSRGAHEIVEGIEVIGLERSEERRVGKECRL